MEKEPKELENNRNPDGTFKKGMSGNPNGRTVGSKDYVTLYREAIIKIAESKDMTPEDIENDLAKSGILNAIKGNYSFYRDTMDRIHGRPKENLEVSGDITIELTQYGDKD